MKKPTPSDIGLAHRTAGVEPPETLPAPDDASEKVVVPPENDESGNKAPQEPDLYFSSVELKQDTRGNRFLNLELAENPQVMTEQANQLYQLLTSTEMAINTMLEGEKDRQSDMFETLLGYAHQGLVGPNPDTAAATFNVSQFRHNKLRQVLMDFRDRYTRRTNLTSLSLIAICVILFILFAPNAGRIEGVLAGITSGDIIKTAFGDFKPAIILSLLAAYFFGLVGLAIGEIFTAFVASMNVDVDRYAENPRYRFKPMSRLLFGATIWLITLIFLALDWVIIGLGGVKVNDAATGAPWLGLVGGVIVALAFNQVIVTLQSRASSAFQVKKA